MYELGNKMAPILHLGEEFASSNPFSQEAFMQPASLQPDTTLNKTTSETESEVTTETASHSGVANPGPLAPVS